MSSWFNFSPRSVDNYLRDESGTYEDGGRRSISTRQQRTTWKSGNGSESEVFYSPTATADSSSAAIRGSGRVDDSYRSWSSTAAEERGSSGNLGLRSSATQQQTIIPSAASSSSLSSSSSSSSSIFEVQTFWTSGSVGPTLCGLSPSILSPRRVTKFQPIKGSRRLLDHHHHHQSHPSNLLR